ncbi:MAG: glycosyltransferase family 39 protein [bacterium]
MIVDQRRRRTAATWGLLLAIVIVGGGLRLYRIGAKSIWLDEAASLELARRPFFDLVRECARRDTHPPLYYTLLHVWLGGSQAAGRARALSALFGVATIAALYALARRLLPRLPSLVAALVLAVSAYQVYFAQEARHYALTTLLVVVSWYLLIVLLQREGRGWGLWLCLALVNAAGLYTFYYHAFSIAAQLVVLGLLWRDGGRRLVLRWCVWHLVPAALFAFYLPVVFGHIRKLDRLAPTARPGAMTLEELAKTGAQFAAGFLVEMREVAGRPSGALRLGLAVLVLAALGLALAGLKRRRVAVLTVLGWLVVPLASAAVFPFKGHIYEPKHLVFLSPLVALLPAIALTSLPRWWKTPAGAIVVVLVGANAWSLALWYAPGTEKENWRLAALRLAENARQGDVLVLSPPYVHMPFAYHYQPERLGRPCPRLELREARPVGEPFRGTPPLGRRVWVLQCRSNVSMPNPRVFEVLEPYPRVFHEQYRHLVGTIDLMLYDTRQAEP